MGWQLDWLGANPSEALIQQTGHWTLLFLVFTLAVTPVRLLMGWRDLNKRFKLRRIFGLFAFFYSCLHFFAYFLFEQGLDWRASIDDIGLRPAMLLGFVMWLLLLLLAITSNAAMIKKLGKQRWKHLHSLTYVIAIGGVWHFWWLAVAKSDVQEPMIYGLVFAGLFLLRYPPIINFWVKKQ